MRRRRAQLAEVVTGADNTAAEVELPHAVDDHAGGEHILRRGNPLGQNAAAPGTAGTIVGVWDYWSRIAKQLREVRLYGVARYMRIAAHHNMRCRRARIAMSERQRRCWRRQAAYFLASFFLTTNRLPV